MNRAELDAFFAKAEDVLSDWQGSQDAMDARVPDGETELPTRADSYYEQPDAERRGVDLHWVILDETHRPADFMRVWLDVWTQRFSVSD